MSEHAAGERAPLRAVLLSHGGMAEGMVDAVRRITGVGEDVIIPISNTAKSPETLTAEVVAALGDSPGLILTDLQSGSCGFVARRLALADRGHVVISGVNLPLVIDFAMNRTLPISELVPRLLASGRASIGCAPSHLDEHADRAAPRR